MFFWGLLVHSYYVDFKSTPAQMAIAITFMLAAFAFSAYVGDILLGLWYSEENNYCIEELEVRMVARSGKGLGSIEYLAHVRSNIFIANRGTDGLSSKKGESNATYR